MPRKPRIHVPDEFYHAISWERAAGYLLQSAKTRITICVDPIENRTRGTCRAYGFCRMTHHQYHDVQKDDLRGPPRLDAPPDHRA